MRIIIKPEYENLRPFIERVADPRYFADNGETLREGDCVAKCFEADGRKYVVESYGRPSLFQRLSGGFLRRSKAMRAYRHAGKLRRLGIDTPEEVAVAEVRRRGLLQSCCYVSRFSDYRSVGTAAEHFEQRGEEVKPVLHALAGFLVRMHWAGVLHKNLDVNRILYKEEPSQGGKRYRFQIVDTDRMDFRHWLSMRLRLDNMRRLSCAFPAYLYILQQYAFALRTDVDTVVMTGTFYRLLFEKRQRIKRRFGELFR